MPLFGGTSRLHHVAPRALSGMVTLSRQARYSILGGSNLPQDKALRFPAWRLRQV
jgi:hypothetical protein